MKTIGIVTGTRAEYGILKNLIKTCIHEPDLDIKVVVTGTHLSEKYGMTVREIEEDGILIDARISILNENIEDKSISKEMANTLEKFSDYFNKTALDMLIILGDRYEIFAVAIAAMNARIPIAHIHGGEVTEGAMDDAMRHAITKLSYLHFTSAEEYRNRVIQLGEHPSRVFNVGALGIENIRKQQLLGQEELEQSLSFELGDMYAVVTYHPVTLEAGNARVEIQTVIQALLEYPNLKYIITKSNADLGGSTINEYLQQVQKQYSERIIVVDSLGMKRYLSALKYCKMVIGNSSSGILEAPAIGVPTVNIGDRQKGRIQTSSIFNCTCSKCGIQHAMYEALNWNDSAKKHQFIELYQNQNTAEHIAKIIVEWLNSNKIDLKKEFYNL